MNAKIITVSQTDLSTPGELMQICLTAHAALVDCRSRLNFQWGAWDRFAMPTLFGTALYHRNPCAVPVDLMGKGARRELLDDFHAATIFASYGVKWDTLIALVDNYDHATLLKLNLPEGWKTVVTRTRQEVLHMLSASVPDDGAVTARGLL